MEERARKCSSVLLHFIHQFLIGTEMENVIGLNIYSHKSTVSCYRFQIYNSIYSDYFWNDPVSINYETIMNFSTCYREGLNNKESISTIFQFIEVNKSL